MAIGLPEGILLAAIFSALTFGLYTSMFAVTTRVLIQRSKGSSELLRSPVFIVGIVFYLMAIADLCVSIDYVRLAFIVNGDVPEGELIYLGSNNGSIHFNALACIYILQALFGDFFMVYRLSVVWNRDKRVVIPFVILMTANTAIFIGSFRSIFALTGTSDIFTLRQWALSYYSITLTVNGLCTILIAYKIWSIHSAAATFQAGGIRMGTVASIMMETGLIYSSLYLCLLVTYVVGNWAQVILAEMSPSIIGINFSMIILRMHMMKSRATSNPSGSVPLSISQPRSRDNTSRSGSGKVVTDFYDQSRTYDEESLPMEAFQSPSTAGNPNYH